MRSNRRKHRFIIHAEALRSKLCSDTRVQHGRVRALERVDVHPARFAFGEQPLRRPQAGKVVQHSRNERTASILPVAQRQPARKTRDAQRVREAMALTDCLADGCSESNEFEAGQP